MVKEVTRDDISIPLEKQKHDVELDPLYDELHNLVVKECALLKSKDKDKYNRLVGIIKRQSKIREKIKEIQDERESLYTSPLEEYLPGRSKEELKIAEGILTDHDEYPYKTEKIRALLKGGVDIQTIELLMAQQGADWIVTQSYINSIKQKMEE